jgi:hypothetical protein
MLLTLCCYYYYVGFLFISGEYLFISGNIFLAVIGVFGFFSVCLCVGFSGSWVFVYLGLGVFVYWGLCFLFIGIFVYLWQVVHYII